MFGEGFYVTNLCLYFDNIRASHQTYRLVLAWTYSTEREP